MLRKMIYLISFFLTLGLVMMGVANAADPSLVAYWQLDEGTGTIAIDSSGNGNDGTLIGGPQWVAGRIKGALQFDGNNDYVDCGTGPDLDLTTWTITFWLNMNLNKNHTAFIVKGLDSNENYEVLGYADGHLHLPIQFDDGTRTWANTPAGLVVENEWTHFSYTYDSTQGRRIYKNGVLAFEDTESNTPQASTSSLTIGFEQTTTRYLNGIMDDVQLYNRSMTREEIAQTMEGISISPGLASGPNPDDGTTDVPRDVSLSWTPGEFANTHDVYMGTVSADVSDAGRSNPRGVLVSQNQITNTFVPASRLDFGQTYYWRVDEVNAAPDYTIFKGNVWSFTIEPYAYPAENITATASSVNKAIEGPENTINGSGLDDNDLHSSENATMWLSSGFDPNPTWIQYEFDKIHKLHQMLVWNYNSTVEPLVGFSIREATIEYSVDGTNWALLGTTHEFARGPGEVSYAPNTTVDLGGLAAKYIRITANSNWGGILRQYGLSEVRFLYIPVRATEPSPVSGATDVGVDTILSFKAGREAARHDVYLGTDEQAVIDGNVPVAGVTEASYACSLDLAGTYYWRVDEANDAKTPTIWQGDIWNLSTQEYLVVDDFESYNDIATGQEGSNLVYDTWADGFDNPANGSTVGYNVPFQPTMETSILYDGKQSVPLFYDNTAATYSEVTAKVADLDVSGDWTKHNIKALTLRFFGDPNNLAQQMYVKINNSRIAYDGDAENLKRPVWQMWYIDLASIGASLGNVTDLAIGFERIGASGGKGVVYLDGIRLYSYDRQMVTSADPGAVGLQARYEFEGNTNDSSVSKRHGTAVGNPAYVAGKVGQAINLRGLNDYVEITGYKGILGSSAVTVTAWVKTSSTDTGAIVGWGPNVAGQRFGFRVDVGRLRLEHQGGNIQGDTLVNDGAWHHVAVTVQENATISYPEVILYLDGSDDTRPTTDPDAFNLTAGEDVSIGRRPSNNDRFFLGQIDDVRIYERALSPEEIAWIAGRNMPFDKPF